MPNIANRKRPMQVKFFVDEHELAVIKQRISEFGVKLKRRHSLQSKKENQIVLI